LPFAKLSGHNDRYKIKLRSIGYLLVYEVSDKTITILVEAVGKRDKSAVYLSASQRLI
jgi:mRNA interferase RelE/StbE